MKIMNPKNQAAPGVEQRPSDDAAADNAAAAAAFFLSSFFFLLQPGDKTAEEVAPLLGLEEKNGAVAKVEVDKVLGLCTIVKSESQRIMSKGSSSLLTIPLAQLPVSDDNHGGHGVCTLTSDAHATFRHLKPGREGLRRTMKRGN